MDLETIREVNKEPVKFILAYGGVAFESGSYEKVESLFNDMTKKKAEELVAEYKDIQVPVHTTLAIYPDKEGYQVSVNRKKL